MPVQRLGKLVFAALIFCMAAGAGEIAARILRHCRPMLFSIDHVSVGGKVNRTMREDEQLLWRMSPGEYDDAGVHVRINGMGMRGAELTQPKEPGALRILFMGDSSVYGFGVLESKAFPYLTRDMLAEKLDRKVEVANAAVPGYSSTQCRIFFEDNLAKIRPDVVVIAALWSDLMPTQWTDEQLLRRFSSAGYRFNKSARLLMRHSSLFKLLEARIVSARPIPENRQLFWQNILEGSDEGRQRVSAAQHAKNLRAICERCKRENIAVALLVLPYNYYLKYKANEEKSEKNARTTDGSPGSGDPNLIKLLKNYRTASEEYSTAFCNMQDIHRRYPLDKTKDLFLDTIHPSVSGHALIAKELSAQLEKKLQGASFAE